MPTVIRKVLLLVIVMVSLGAAFVSPFLYRDQATDTPAIALAQLKNEAARGYLIPPGVIQVIDVQVYGEYPYRLEGTVIYRSLFGVRVASARFYNNATTYELAGMKLLGVWASFILAEGALGLLLYKWS